MKEPKYYKTKKEAEAAVEKASIEKGGYYQAIYEPEQDLYLVKNTKGGYIRTDGSCY